MPAKKEQKQGKRDNFLIALYVIFFACIVLYAVYNNLFIGIAAVVTIIAILVIEARASIASEGVAGSIKEILIALVAALLIWTALVFILGTSSPIDAVASCSMLPTLQRGDLVVLHGISNYSEFTSTNHIPVVSMTQSQFSNFESSINNEFVAFYAYPLNNKSNIATFVEKNETGYEVALYNTACISRFTYMNESYNIYKCQIASQQGDPIQYGYSLVNVTYSGTRVLEIATSSISILNQTITPNYSRPIIVYKTTSQDSFSGDIIHRVYASIDVNGTYYMLTKGDNNQALDIEFANYPPAGQGVVGYVVLDVPVVGYVKLLLSGQLASVPGCNIVTQLPK